MLPGVSGARHRRKGSSSSRKRLGSFRSTHSKPEWNPTTSLQESSVASSLPRKTNLALPNGLSNIRRKMLKR